MFEKENFIIALAESIHQNGIPAHRLENTMQMVCESIGVEADFSATPEILLISFSTDGSFKTHMKKCKGSDLNFEKMTLLDQLIEKVMKGQLSIEAAKEELDRIKTLPKRYGALVNTFSIGVSTSRKSASTIVCRIALIALLRAAKVWRVCSVMMRSM
jgi:uncharacterized membrane protein YjjP (DUF1212 family)